MSEIQFTTIVGPDGVIRPPEGMELPQGAMEVSLRPIADANSSFEVSGRELATRRGLNWDTLSDDVRAILIADIQFEERGLRPPRPAPGACKGMIQYMAPDFDAPLEEMKEYME
jgi:hypothetical protein